MELTLDIKEERINFFLELIKQFDFVNIKNKEAEKSYNPEFVAKIEKSTEDFKAGRYKKIATADLWK